MLRFLLWYRREGHFIAVINLGRLECLAIDGSDEVGEIMTALRDAYCRLSSAWLRADCKYDMGGARVERRQCSPGD